MTLRGGRAGGEDARDEDELELARGFERTRVWIVEVGDVARVLPRAGRVDGSPVVGRVEDSAAAGLEDGRLVRRLAKPALGL